MRIKSNALLKFAVAGVFGLAFAGLALASGHDREHRGHGRGDHRERGDCHSQPAAVTAPTIQIISPVDGTFTTLPTTTVEVSYTAPAGTIPLITLLRDGVAVDSFTIPTGSTAGNVIFVQDISTVNGPTSFQAQIAYVAGGGDDDHDGRDEHHDGHSKKCKDGKKGKHGEGRSQDDDEDDDEDDDDGAGGTVTVVLSNVVNVLHTVVVTPPPVFF